MYITTVAYTQEHPITMPMVGAGQMPMLNARVHLFRQLYALKHSLRCNYGHEY